MCGNIDVIYSYDSLLGVFMSEQWLTIIEYARNKCVSGMTIRRRIKSGKLSAVIRNGKYYIHND